MNYRAYTPGHAKPRSALLTRLALVLGAVLVAVTVAFGGYAAGTTLVHQPAHTVVHVVPSHCPRAPAPSHPAPGPSHPATGPGAAALHLLHLHHLAHLHVLHLLHLLHLGVQME